MAETVQVMGTVAAIDKGKRTARLKFEDGTAKMCPGRNDADLSERKVGATVIFQYSEMIAIDVRKP